MSQEKPKQLVSTSARPSLKHIYHYAPLSVKNSTFLNAVSWLSSSKTCRLLASSLQVCLCALAALPAGATHEG